MNQAYAIREITASDTAEFIRLRLDGLTHYPEAFAETANGFASKSVETVKSEIEGLYISNGFLMGAFSSDNRLLGIVGFQRNSWERLKHRGHIWGVYTDRFCQRQGIAKALFNAVIRKAKTISGLVQLDLGAVATNQNSIDLYSGLGFKQCGTQPKAYKINGIFYDECTFSLDIDSFRSAG